MIAALIIGQGLMMRAHSWAEFDQALRCGMSWDLSAGIAARAMCHADNAYDIAHMKITIIAVNHTQSNTAFVALCRRACLGLNVLWMRWRTILGLTLAGAAVEFLSAKKWHTLGYPLWAVVEDCVIQPIIDELVKTSIMRCAALLLNLTPLTNT